MAATAMDLATPKVERDENGRLKKGSILNPGGHPAKRDKLIGHWVREQIEDLVEGHKVIKRLVEIMEKDKNSIAAVAAAKLLLEYGYGKPAQRVEMTGADGEPLRQVIIIGNQRIEF